jgi:Ca2+:H+ antiporter
MNAGTLSAMVREEWFLAVGIGTCLAFVLFGGDIWSGPQIYVWPAFAWLFAVALGSALAVVRHADHLAEQLGEPYGTLILTLAVTTIEIVSISAVMLHGENNPTLARDTLFAVVMIILNGMVGLSLLIGAWRHREQQYNLQGANAYLSVILPLAVFGMILPNFTVTTGVGTLSFLQQMFLVVMSLGLYATFLGIQTGRHRGYFTLIGGTTEEVHHATRASSRSRLTHAGLLAAYMVPVVFLAHELAVPVDYIIETLRAPAAFGGVIIALLVATPEAVGAVRAAATNQLQRSVNIFLGSVLATIGLTIPAMLAISNLTGREIILGLVPADSVILVLTLGVSVVTFASGRTNVLQGAVHFLLFLAYVLLLFQG